MADDNCSSSDTGTTRPVLKLPLPAEVPKLAPAELRGARTLLDLRLPEDAEVLPRIVDATVLPPFALAAAPCSNEAVGPAPHKMFAKSSLPYNRSPDAIDDELQRGEMVYSSLKPEITEGAMRIAFEKSVLQLSIASIELPHLDTSPKSSCEAVVKLRYARSPCAHPGSSGVLTAFERDSKNHVSSKASLASGLASSGTASKSSKSCMQAGEMSSNARSFKLTFPRALFRSVTTVLSPLKACRLLNIK
mmetsp:Transcript_114955/g.332175  ORF Transcript_114955/g.332175 Transcript_114955/m.332175 type:complete len:248 (-) Transcript_114955:1015-1758(-)